MRRRWPPCGRPGMKGAGKRPLLRLGAGRGRGEVGGSASRRAPASPLARGVPQRAPAHCPLPAAGRSIARAACPLRKRREEGRRGGKGKAATDSESGSLYSASSGAGAGAASTASPAWPCLTAAPPARPRHSLHCVAPACPRRPPLSRFGSARPDAARPLPPPASLTHKAALRAAHSSALAHSLTITLSSAPRGQGEVRGRPAALSLPRSQQRGDRPLRQPPRQLLRQGLA